MKIIHCADLHLDSKMDCTLPKNMSIKRNHELCMTFCNMVEFADKNKVQVIMICGDLFDSSSVKFTTLSFVLSLIKKHPNIIFFYLRGNHDEQYNLSQEHLPSNLKLFSSEWQYYRLKDVIFAGIEFNEHNPQSLYSKLRLPYDTTNIVMMHGQIGANSEKNVINLAAFHSAPIDYLALGHSHSYKENSLPLRGKWCYSGCLEGRGFDETGQKGFVLLDIHNHSVHSEFIPFAYRLHHKFDLV